MVHDDFRISSFLTQWTRWGRANSSQLQEEMPLGASLVPQLLRSSQLSLPYLASYQPHPDERPHGSAACAREGSSDLSFVTHPTWHRQDEALTKLRSADDLHSTTTCYCCWYKGNLRLFGDAMLSEELIRRNGVVVLEEYCPISLEYFECMKAMIGMCLRHTGR